MSALVTNQAQMRPKITTGSPKKNAAWRSFSNTNGGTRPGVVSTCQAANTSTSTTSCQARRLPARGLSSCHMVVAPSGRELLAVALEDLLAQHAPDRVVQF